MITASNVQTNGDYFEPRHQITNISIKLPFVVRLNELIIPFQHVQTEMSQSLLVITPFTVILTLCEFCQFCTNDCVHFLVLENTH